MGCRPCERGLLAVVLAWSLCGCGGGSSDAPPLHSVSGSVTFAGAPVEDGEIRFVAKDGSRTDGGRITGGKYSLQTTSGAKRVEIYATRSDPANLIESAVEPGKMEPATEMYIPDKYNVASELEANLTEGKNSADFPLEK